MKTHTFLINAHHVHLPASIYSATEYHLGLLKAKLAKYRAQLLEPSKSAGAAKVRISLLCFRCLHIIHQYG